MKIAAAYIRVSTEAQTEYSPDSQIRLIKDYAKNHSYYIPDDLIFADEGISGRKAEKRPAFQKMISAAKLKQFEVILIYSTSRFARNLEDSIVYKSMLQRECGVDVISITQPFVDKKTDMLTNAIYSVLDEWYSIDLAENVKRGMTEKALRGGYQCSPPFGYSIPVKKEPPVMVESEAIIVKMAFDMFTDSSKMPFSIAREFNALGIKTQRGGLWERRRIEYMLKNPAYCGKAVWNKKNNNKSLNDPSEWIVVDGTHVPIVSVEQFDKAQEIFRACYKERKARPTGTYKHWLSGIIKCEYCGRTLTYSQNLKGWNNFSCNGYKKGVCAKSNSISQLKAEKAFFESINEVLTDNSKLIYERIYVKDNQDKTLLLKAQLNKLDPKLERFKEAYSVGIDTIEEYKENKSWVLKEKEEILKQIGELDKRNPDIVDINKVLRAITNLLEILHDDKFLVEQKSVSLKKVVSKIVYSKKDSKFEVFYICN